LQNNQIQTSFAPKTNIFRQNLHYFSGKTWELNSVVLHIFPNPTATQKIKKNAALAARAVYICPILLLSP
jgi:hypothetical protein